MRRFALSRIGWRVRLIFPLGLILACGLVAACSSLEKEREVKRLHAQAAYETALKHLQDKRVSLGLVSLQQALSLEPENPQYRSTLGVVYLDLRRPADAQVEFERALAAEPNNAETQHNLGLSYAEQGRLDDAIAAYQKALLNPTYTTPEVAYNNLGNAYFAQGKLREAEESYRAALKLSPRMPSALYGLGMALSRQGRRDEARAVLRSVSEVDATSPFVPAAAEALKALGEGAGPGAVTR